MPFDPTLRDRLCALEPQDPLLRERYQEEVRAMFEQKLSASRKFFIALVGIASLGIAVFLGAQAVVHAELPSLARASMAAGVLFSLAWAGLAGWTVYRGTWYLKIQPTAMAALSWVFAVMLVTSFLVLAPQFPDRFYAGLAIASGLVILIGAGVSLVCMRVQQAELRTQESLLKLEYQLAELAEGRRP